MKGFFEFFDLSLLIRIYISNIFKYPIFHRNFHTFSKPNFFFSFLFKWRFQQPLRHYHLYISFFLHSQEETEYSYIGVFYCFINHSSGVGLNFFFFFLLVEVDERKLRENCRKLQNTWKAK